MNYIVFFVLTIVTLFVIVIAVVAALLAHVVPQGRPLILELQYGEQMFSLAILSPGRVIPTQRGTAGYFYNSPEEREAARSRSRNIDGWPANEYNNQNDGWGQAPNNDGWNAEEDDGWGNDAGVDIP